jgi:hypothetical protein
MSEFSLDAHAFGDCIMSEKEFVEIMTKGVVIIKPGDVVTTETDDAELRILVNGVVVSSIPRGKR